MKFLGVESNDFGILSSSTKNYIVRTFFGFGIIASLLSPAFAHAGFFSFVSEILGQASAETEIVAPEINSQNVALLKAILSSDPNPGRGGSDVSIVGNALVSDGSAFEFSEGVSGSQITTYIVRAGDSLSKIAELFEVSVNTIIWANDLPKNAKITQGQSLLILPISGVRHVVKSGDTLTNIAKRYKGDIDDILDYNNLTSNSKLAVGDIIIIPDGEVAAVQIVAPRTTSSSVAAIKGGGPEYVGYYMRPIIGGYRSQGVHGNNGVDLAAPIGTPIYASAAGTVIISRAGGWNGGYGNYIVISHGNKTQTLYSHNSKNLVSEGDVVEKGQLIGLVGSTGKSTGPHIHFEIRGAKNPF